MAKTKQKAEVAAPYAALHAAGSQAAEAVTKALEGYGELVAAGKDNLNAMVQANTAATTGAKRLNTAFAANLKAAYEANLAAARALADVKTVHEAVELQTGHARDTFDAAIAQGTELSELALEVANDVAEPLKVRTKVAFDKLLKPIAA